MRSERYVVEGNLRSCGRGPIVETNFPTSAQFQVETVKDIVDVHKRGVSGRDTEMKELTFNDLLLSRKKYLDNSHTAFFSSIFY